MNRWSLLFVTWILLPVAAVAQQVVREQPVMLQLDVNAVGWVTSAKVVPSAHLMLMVNRHRKVSYPPRYPALPDVLAKAAVQAASTWRFQAPVVSGRSVPGRTWVYTTLQIVKRRDGKYGVALKYGSNGPYIREKIIPQYPVQMRLMRAQGAVVIDAMVQPDGSVTDVHATKIFTDGPGYSRVLAAAARGAVRNWKGTPMMVDGRAVATHMRIPFMFYIKGASKAETDRLDSRVQKYLASERKGGQEAGPVRSGEAVALDSPFVKQPSS